MLWGKTHFGRLIGRPHFASVIWWAVLDLNQ